MSADTYPIAVYRAEVSELVGNKMMTGKSAWRARLQLDEAERALTVTGDRREYTRRLEHVARCMADFEEALSCR